MAYNPTDWQNLPDTTTPITKNRLNNIETGIKTLDNAIGISDYDNTATYEIGDYCRYNNQIYKCNTTISTAENWTIAHWTSTSIENEINIKENINNKITTIDNESTNTQYPSAKAVYDYVEELNTYSTTEQKVGTWINRKTTL